MNNKEASINKVDELVNRAQLAINDWHCSGETYYLRQAQANLGSALELARAARVAVLAAEKAEAYSVGDVRSPGCGRICSDYKKYKFVLAILNGKRQAKAKAVAECRAMRNERIREWKHNKCWPKG